MSNLATDLTTTIGEVMGAVLVRDPLASDEDFFRSGGDSLRAIEVLQQLAGRDDVPTTVGTPEVQAQLLEAIFDDASPAALAAVVSTHA